MTRWGKGLFLTLALFILWPACASAANRNQAVFTHIVYAGHDDRTVARGHFANPILPGFHPDPAITRVGDDYYLVNSSFAFFPGIPVYHSTDLVHWQQIGSALDRPGQVDFSGLDTSSGVWAPDISFHDGTYYIVNTCSGCGGNYVITASHPAGPWSDPVWLPFGGIDPSLFFDDDGKAYVINPDDPATPPLYYGNRVLWLQQLDLKTRTLTGPRIPLINNGDYADKHIFIEGPHLFKARGYYYVIAAADGTWEGHTEVVYRAKTLLGPYEAYAGNPILTQSNVDASRPHAVTSAGHADLVETRTGQWWAVFLGTRPYAKDLYNTGRETFMLPVTWKDGWPVILPPKTPVPLRPAVPDLAQAGHRQDPLNPLAWLSLRTPKGETWHRLGADSIVLDAMPDAIGDPASHPAFIGVRQSDTRATFSADLAFRPHTEGERAGIAAIQSDNFYVFYGMALRNGVEVLEVTRRAGANDPRDGVVLATLALAPDHHRLSLSFDIDGAKMAFRYRLGGQVHTLLDGADATVLSSKVANGYVGTVIGPYAYRPQE